MALELYLKLIHPELFCLICK